MQRRKFLRTTVLVAGGISLFGCGTSDSKGGDEASEPSFGGRSIVDGALYFPQSVASGDPRETSVILWTRAADEKADGDLTLMLEVALDAEFKMRVDLGDSATLTAESDHDGCVRVRVENLEPGSIYHYRFAYIVDDQALTSRTGRTKTAASATQDVAVNFAVASCQDYAGRYYHAYKHLAEQELDFFLHLGDYVYETTGDPAFQATMGKRVVKFEDSKDAIALGEGDASFFAASALANYRDLYKTFRSDADIQRVHELFPMIAIWDDHEFSDDCHGQTATYSDGAEDETNPTRRANADQAWFEFMPVDYAESDFSYDRKVSFPADITIYRDFTFGKNLHVVMTDLRRYRDDHLVPEDAFPGAIPATQQDLVAALGAVPDFAVAYVNLDAAEYLAQKTALNANAVALGFVEGDFAGLIDVKFANAQSAKIVGAKPPPIDATDKPRGISFASMFKTSRFSNVGSRYVLLTEPFAAYARVLWTKSNGKAQQVMGDKQEKWFIDTVRKSKQTWKVWGNEYTLMPRVVDLREQAIAASIGLQALLNLSAEDWDGMPDRRSKIIDSIGDVANIVAVTGDIHAFFAGVARNEGDDEKGIVEFVAGAISSASYFELLNATAATISPLAGGLAANAEALLMAANPHLDFIDLKRNGYGLFKADGSTLSATYYAIAPENVLKVKAPADLKKAFAATAFSVKAGEKAIQRAKS